MKFIVGVFLRVKNAEVQEECEDWVGERGGGAQCAIKIENKQ